MGDLNAIATMGIPNVNVRMEFRNIKTGKIVNLVETHNRVTKHALLGMIRMIDGEFNSSTPFQIANYIPRYFALGSNQALGNNNAGITTEVTVNDTRLLSEIDYPRTRLIQKNIITNRYNDPYIKLTIRHYIPNNAYVDQSLAEAGLFSDKTGNNCWARITFDRFVKDDETVIDITWEITIVSMESEKDPYTSIDKLNLYKAMKEGLEEIGNSYPNLKDLCDAIQTGITDYAKKDASQQLIDSDTEAIQKAMDFSGASGGTLISDHDYTEALRLAKEIRGDNVN